MPYNDALYKSTANFDKNCGYPDHIGALKEY